VAANCEKIAKLFVAKVITKMPFSQHPKKQYKRKENFIVSPKERKIMKRG